MTIFFCLVLIFIKILFVCLIYSEKFVYKKTVSFIYIFFSFSFIYYILPFRTDYTTYQNFLDYLTITIVLGLCSLTGFFYLLAYKVKKILTRSIIKVFFFGAILVVAEFFVALSGGLIFFKHGNDIMDYSYFNTGYALSFSYLGKAAYFGHVYSLTFLLGLIISFIYEYAPKRKYYFMAIVFLFCCLGFKNITSNNTPNNIAVEKENKKLNIDDRLKYDYLIYNLKYYENKNVYGITFFENNKTGDISKIYKYALMPFGEYFPEIFSLLKNINKDGIENFNFKDVVSYNSGNNIVNIDGKKYLILICADAWSYRSVQRYKNHKIDYIIIQTNDNIFHNSPFYEANTLLYQMNLENYFGVSKIIKKG